MRLVTLFTVLALGTSTVWAETHFKKPSVKPGIDVLIEEGFRPLVGKRVGLITNPTGITSDMRPTIDVLYDAKEVNLVALLAPEHGIRGDEYAGDYVDGDKDAKTGLPVYSLYGKTRKPTDEALKNLDVLVFDVQDIGSRSYTFISSMASAMNAAAKKGISFVVLDRPNPLGGFRVEGRPLTDMKFKSFVSYLPIAYIHGMTVGELAKMINGEGWNDGGLKCDLTVIPCKGLNRKMNFQDTGLPWVLTSPHITRPDTSMFYAATGIMGELRTVSEGVGYPLPFEIAGAPNFDAQKLASHMNSQNLPGVFFRPIYYKPFYASYAKKICGGVQLHITDPEKVHLTSIQFHIMDYVRKNHPEMKLFGNKRDNMFDKVCGTDQIRKMFQEGKPLNEILAVWNEGIEEFKTKRSKYLLYN